MTTLRDIGFRLGYELDKASEAQVENSINSLKSMAKTALGAIGVTLSISGLANLAQAAADAEALKSQFTQVFGDMEQSASESLEKIASDTGVMSGRLKGSFTQIAAFAKTTGADEADALAISERALAAAVDSAAFYDREIEDVTESLQSFLKGNFANDAALGLSCTETTRNAAANALYGKSFKDLSEAEKQLTLLQMVEDANATSGALGQAARESDTWTNQLGNLKQAIVELKQKVGGVFLQPAITILKTLTSVVQKATQGVQWLTDRFGGAQNLLKALIVTIGGIFLALNAGKILNFLKTAGSMINAHNLKIMAIVAAVVLLALLVEDFFAFMKGEDSLIGTMMEKAGVDTDGFRETCKDLWNQLKQVWDVVKQCGRTIGGAFLDAIKTLLPLIGRLATAILPVIFQLIQKLVPFIVQIAQTVLPMIASLVERLLPMFVQVVEQILPVIIGLIETLLPLIMQIIEAVLPVIISLIETLLPLIMQIIEAILPVLLELITAIVPILAQIIETILPVVLELISAILPILEPIITLVSSLVSALLPPIVSLLSAILPILQPILGVLQPIADVLGVIIGAIAKVVGWVASGLGWIVDLFFGGGGDTETAAAVNAYAKGTESSDDTFIAGEEGPELITGQSGKKVFTALQTGKIFEAMALLGKAATAKPSTVTTSNSNRTVNQYNEFVNTFNGDVAGQKKSKAAMTSASDDATSMMARALAFAR